MKRNALKSLITIVLVLGMLILAGGCDGQQNQADTEKDAAFDYLGIARLWMCSADVDNLELTIDLCGVFIDGRARESGSGGSSGDIDSRGFKLRVGGKDYTEGTVREIIIEQHILEIELCFELPDELESESNCELYLRPSDNADYDKLTEFAMADGMLADKAERIQANASVSGLRISAYMTWMEDGLVAVKLYSDTAEGMKAAGYGFGGDNFNIPDGLGLLNSDSYLCLTDGKTIIEPAEPRQTDYYPDIFCFEINEKRPVSMKIPYVVYSADTEKAVNIGCFNGEDCEEAVECGFGGMVFAVSKTADGENRLEISAYRGDNSMRLCGVETTVNGEKKCMALGEISESLSPKIPIGVIKGADAESCDAEIIIEKIYYAELADLELNFDM